MNYDFPTVEYRARCTRVVDGDTADLLIDLGFHDMRRERFRLLGIDTPELRSGDEATRIRAEAARAQLTSWLMENMDEWPLRIQAKRDPDSFGRWLAKIWVHVGDQEICVNNEMLRLNLAVEYTR